MHHIIPFLCHRAEENGQLDHQRETPPLLYAAVIVRIGLCERSINLKKRRVALDEKKRNPISFNIIIAVLRGYDVRSAVH